MNKMNKKDFKRLSKGVAFDKVVTPLYDDLDKAEVLLTEAKTEAKIAQKEAKIAEEKAKIAEEKADEGLYLTEDVRNRLDNLVDSFNTAKTEYTDIEADMNETISVKERISRLAENTLHSTDLRPDTKDKLFNALSDEVKYNERQINKSIHELEGINSRKNRLCQKIGELFINEVI